jgi:hypothetical protein
MAGALIGQSEAFQKLALYEGIIFIVPHSATG